MSSDSANPLPGVRRVFKRLTVDVHFNPIVSRRILIEWALDPSFIANAYGPYTFRVYWGGAANGDDWTSVCEVVDQPWAYDTSPQLPRGKGMGFFYKVVLTDGEGNTYESQAVSGTTHWGRYDWTLARDIIRKETMLMRKRTGIKGYLYKRRGFGDRCSCTDPDTGQVMNPDCEECYGTGYVGGYYEPFEYWVTMNPGQQIRKLDAEVGLIVENIETVRALAYPAPDSNDFWVSASTDQRFVIMEGITGIARHRGIDLVLELRLQEKSRSDSIYQIPMPCGASNGIS